jgi:hypothetical protein
MHGLVAKGTSLRDTYERSRASTITITTSAPTSISGQAGSGSSADRFDILIGWYPRTHRMILRVRVGYRQCVRDKLYTASIHVPPCVLTFPAIRVY